MKDQYVADVNDYLKYALLRRLVGRERRLTVAWMLTASDGRSDGQQLGYLRRPEEYRRLDPPLFDSLKQLVQRGERNVRAVERAAVLPGAAYVSEELHDSRMARERYFARVFDVSAAGDLVFFDPDNGLGVASVLKGRRHSAKYLYWDEVANAYEEDRSLVIYQHFPRRPRDAFIRELMARVHEVTGCARVLALATPHVAFFVVPQHDAARDLGTRLAYFSSHAAPYTTTSASIQAQRLGRSLSPPGAT